MKGFLNNFGILFRKTRSRRKRNLDGKAAYPVAGYTPSDGLPDCEFPLSLSTGRQLFQYHTGTMTRRVDAIDKISPCAYIEKNPHGAAHMDVYDEDTMRVFRHSATCVVYVPFHFREAAANTLASRTLDQVTKIPEFKVCAAKTGTFRNRELSE